jgi:putative membrane protein
VIVVAHAVDVITPGGVWASWTANPFVLVPLALWGAAFGRGASRLRRVRGSRGVSPARIGAFYCALIALALALVSPLDALGETLFSAHMAQHLVLLLLVPPLLCYADPIPPSVLALPASMRRALRPARSRVVRSAERVVLHPLTTGSLLTAAMWGWHFPALYEAALHNPLVHALEHASFLVTATLLWSTVIARRNRARAPYGARLGLLFVTSVQSGGLGALLSFATSALYPIHEPGARAWGLTLLEDQQLAGAIMWIPAGVVYTITMAVVFLRGLEEMERTTGGDNGDTGRAVVWSGEP